MESALYNRQVTFGHMLHTQYVNKLDPNGEAALSTALAAGKVQYDAFMALVASNDPTSVATFKSKYNSDSESAFEDILETRVKADISYRKN